MEHADNEPPFPLSERVEAGPLAELSLTSGKQSVFVNHAFSRLEMRFEGGEGVPPIGIVSGLEWPQLGARYVVVQEPLMREDPHRGWAPVGGVHSDALLVGPSEAGQLTFPACVGAEEGVLICAYATFLSLTACGSTVAVVRLGVGDLLTAAEASCRRQEGLLAA
jgi:hypothetical protein